MLPPDFRAFRSPKNSESVGRCRTQESDCEAGVIDLIIEKKGVDSYTIDTIRP